jgi:hypothetical protein
MLKIVLATVVALAFVASPVVAGKKKPRPHLSTQVVGTMQASQESLAKLKIKSHQIYKPRRPAVTIIH